jgi:hypothetical protein
MDYKLVTVTEDERALWDEIFSTYARMQYKTELCADKADEVIRTRRARRPGIEQRQA